MKAVICESYGEPNVLKLKDIEKPIPKPNEILIRIRATAVNSADVRVRGLQVSGIKRILMYLVLGLTKPRKKILGVVLSGVVEEVGNNVQTFKKGDEVFGMTGFQFGTYAEYISLKEKSAVCLKPKNANFQEAASIIFGGSTAYYFLKKAKIEELPKKVLIYGATGSVGISAIQIANYFGADVSAVCGTNGIGLVKSLGVKSVYDYNSDWIHSMQDRFDVIFDAVGKLSQKQCEGILRPGGKFFTVEGWDTANETIEQLEFLKE
ncbi:MAG TPA: NAD(P)-dependent alcohol dehydrogenase, partial [Leptospiraceae bacterium]|nr:NAD(P)-dependent alcohol dehydrogenase [Leptospiraceae bacterium]